MRHLLMVWVVVMMIFVLPAAGEPALSSWSLLTEREWVPEAFSIGHFHGVSLDNSSFFLGAERRWNNGFSSFVGLGVADYDLPGFQKGQSAMAGLAFNVNRGVSLYLEFEEKKLNDGFGDPDDQVVTFRTVISF